MAQFSDLPFELRTRIFNLSLPSPRVLHVIRKISREPTWITEQANKNKAEAEEDVKFIVSKASYGGRHPAVLHINHESRTEALKHLTKHLGVYWNMETDYPYFEIHDIRDKEAMWMTEVYNAGLMEPFCNIAIDTVLWYWKTSSASMEFKTMFGRHFTEIIAPPDIMKGMPHLKNLALTYTNHTLQKDVVTPGQAWNLGDVTAEVALDEDFEKDYQYKRIRDVPATRIEPHTWGNVVRLEKRLNIQVRGIHGRQREYFPPGKPLRPPPLPANYYDWFG